MPIPRRRQDPAELAAVLHRLERLRIGAPPAGASAASVAGADLAGGGWVPSPPADTQPIAAAPVRLPAVDAPAAHGAIPPAAAAPRSWESLRRGRFDPGRRGLAVLAILALLGALGGAWYFVAAGASAGASPGPSPSARVDSSSVAARVPPALASGWPTASAASPSPIVVDVVGKVASPGVVQLPAGARIHDAIEAAGGALPGTDLTALDLARRLLDGQEVFVGIPPPSGAATDAGGAVVGGNVAPVGTGDGSPPSGVIDINTATSQQLQALPGVGPVLAQHILDWRNQHGAFTSVAQLQQVAGIGPAKYAALMAHVSV